MSSGLGWVITKVSPRPSSSAWVLLGQVPSQKRPWEGAPCSREGLSLLQKGEPWGMGLG